jgi:uroporphyrinogen decarboxylase
MMNSRERVWAALHHQKPDRVPRFEVWIDTIFPEQGISDPIAAYAQLGQDGVIMPSQIPAESNAWRDGIDEWGRVWQNGTYRGGVVENDRDLVRYSPPPGDAVRLFDPDAVRRVRDRYPDHCLFYGTHAGPFTAAYMAMGFDRFFVRLVDDPAFVHRLLEQRTEWCIALFNRAVELGAEVIVVGDDAAHHHGSMISPVMWREHVLNYHKAVVDALPVPVIWHSDGNVDGLLPMAVEAGFTGVHGLEPAAGMDLAATVEHYGHELVLVGNVDVGVLLQDDLNAVRREIDRCLDVSAQTAGYMLSTCNSIFEGMHPESVAEFFRYGGTENP